MFVNVKVNVNEGCLIKMKIKKSPQLTTKASPSSSS
jgi:hypothetical protein